MAREVWMTKWMKDHQLPVQIPLDPECRELVFKMPNGTEISVEIFERDGYAGIKIRTMDGQLIVEPEASNVVTIRAETYQESRSRYETV